MTGDYSKWRWLLFPILFPIFFFGILGWWALRLVLIFGGVLLALLILALIL